MSYVFLSYSTKDHFFCELVRRELEEAKISIWIDKTGLRAGDAWRQEIEDAIANCSALLLAMSPSSVESPYVNFEWAYALGKEKVLIPMLLETCTIHPRLSQIQMIDFSHRAHSPWPALVARIKDIESDADAPDRPTGLQGPTTTATGIAETKEDKAANQILAYLDAKGYRMVSFQRVRRQINKTYTDAFLTQVISQNSDRFRKARLKGNKAGIAKTW